MAGLLAGLATIVYATGAIVLSLRLQFVHLPWINVVPQLPRELVLSVGAGQVLLPSLLVGALYGLYRILRKDRANPPTVHRLLDRERLRDGIRLVLPGYAVGLGVMIVPLIAVLLARVIFGRFDPPVRRIIGVFPVLLFAAAAAVAIQEIRAAVIRNHRSMRKWNSFRAGATMAGIYSAAAIPAIMAGVAAIPLGEAQICTTDNHAIKGLLVGEASDRVYIGEQGHGSRRIVVFPFSKVETMFIGQRAGERCVWRPAPRVAGSGS